MLLYHAKGMPYGESVLSMKRKHHRLQYCPISGYLNATDAEKAEMLLDSLWKKNT